MTTPHSLPVAGGARRLAAATLADTVGTGLYYTVFPLFLILTQGLHVGQVGLALGLASACGLAGGPVIGHIADRTALRPTLVASYLFLFVGATALPFCRSYPLLTAVLCLNAVASEGGRAVRYAMIARLGGSGRVSLRAKLRVVTNIGLCLGTALGGIAVQLDQRSVYTAALLVNAASFAAAAAIQRRLPRMAALPSQEPATASTEQPKYSGVLADPRYLLVTALNGILFLETRVLTLGVPLWVATHNNLPRWTVSLSFLINTLLVIALQIRMSHGVATAAAAGRSWLRAGLAFLVSCAVFPLSGILPAGWAIAVLALAVAVHTCGEMWHMAGSFELALGLAPTTAQGQYQGVFNLGEGISMTVGPIVTALLCVGLGIPGWLIMGGILASAGGLGSSFVRRVSRLPQPYGDRIAPRSAEPNAPRVEL